tara:strand:+ start:197 stop:445 length:249 start_codon:yes stop_codon:yes gene_type:complete
MNNKTKKLEVSRDELDLIASALETQMKILNMQANAGGHGALARLNEVKRLLATVSSRRDKGKPSGPQKTGMWSLLRAMGPAF